MADINTGFEIEVSAVVDEASAKEAGKKLNTYVLNSLKDGYIKIPAAVEAEFKKDGKASKQLREAHREFIDQWKKMSSVGFDSSSEELNDFVKKYNKFIKLMSKEGQYNTKQNNALKESGLGALLKTYTSQINKLEKRLSDLASTTTKVTTTKDTVKTGNKRVRIKNNAATDEDTEYYDDLARGAGRAKASTPGGPTNLGVRLSGWDDTYLSKDRLQANDKAGTYVGKNKWMNSMMASMKKARKDEKDSLKIEKDPKKVKKATDTVSRKQKHREELGLSDVDAKAREKVFAKVLLKELGSLEGKLIEGKSDTAADDMIDQLALILSNAKANNESLDKTVLSINEALMKRYDGSKGTLGVTDGSITGEGPNQEEANKTLKNIYKILDQLTRIEEHVLVAATKNADTTSVYAKLKTALGDTEGTRQLRSVMDKILQTENKRYVQDVRDYSMERMADSAEATKNRENLAANLSTARISEIDANTGTNTDAVANILIEQLVGIKAASEKMSGTLELIAKSLIGTDKINDSKTEKQTILSKISTALNSISTYTKNIATSVKSLAGKQSTNSRKSNEKGSRKKQPKDVIYQADYNPTPHPLAPILKPVGDLIERSSLALAVIPDFIKPREQTVKTFPEDSRRWVPAGLDKLSEVFKKPEKIKPEFMKPRKEQPKIETPDVIQLPDDLTIDKTSLKKILNKIFKSSESEADRIMKMSRAEQARMYAERVNTFGTNNGRQMSDTGSKANAKYIKSLFHHGGQDTESLFQNVKLTPGYKEVNTDEILSQLNKVLSGPAMFNAQTGGGTLKNLLGSMTLYAGMPSLEKSRAEADGLNQVMANVRKEVLKLIQELQTKQDTLGAMVQSGAAKFDRGGGITSDSSPEAKKMFTDMEEQKRVLTAALSEVQRIDEVIKSCDGNVSKIVKRIGFVMPELKDQNIILQNINAGLDKNGKALKFQTRTAETLNYSFQLMSRHIGQMFKNWMVQLNPLTQIKKLFADFASYDVKWQRTMNVIKYNLRRIVRPMMEWIAQQLVNMIGLVNALIKGIGKAFGKDWDLFDQDAANAEKIREELEQAANVSAGFDELHDIGSETGGGDPAMDLLGDIYTPQWEGLNAILEQIGETIGKIIKAVSDWTFWDWLKLIGAALVGYIALKWLISLFSKKNPLEAVAKGFSFLEKAVGWAILIWAFTSFTKALTEFVECMKTATWPDIAKALVMLGVAFAELVGSILLLEKVSKVIGTSAGEMVGLAALVWVFGEFVKAVIPFIECTKELIKEGVYWETLGGMILGLVSAFGALIGGVAAVEGVTKAIGLMGPELLGLAAVVGVFSLFVSALTPFIEMIHDLGDDKIETIVGTFGALVSAFLALAVGVGTVSRAFTAMDWSSIGQLAVVAVVFDLFMMSLIPFVDAIKDTPFEALAGGAVLIASAFLSLAGAVAILAPALAILSWNSVAQLVVVMAAFAGVIWVLKEFVLALQTLSEGQIATGLQSLGATLLIVAGAIGVLAAIFTALVATGVGALAIGLLAGVLAVSALVIVALAELVTALGESGEGIKLILEGVAMVIESIGTQITGIFQTIADGVIGTVTAIGEAIATVITSIGDAIATVIESVASGIETVLTSISDFVDNVLNKIIELAATVAQEVGETIRGVVETVGDVIVRIIEAIVTAIQNLMTAILSFIRDLGPAIDTFVTSLCNTITKMVNFIVSAFEYILNVGVSVINGLISAANKVPGVNLSYASRVSIPRFVPAYEQGTNYVPSDGLAYLHEGEAVIPKKYNQPYSPGLSTEEQAYMQQMISTMKSLDGTIKQGISVNGQFVQRGSDLVAVVNKTKSQTGADLLSNVSYAR